MDYQPPHEVKDKIKLSEMIQSLVSGKSLPPIIVMGHVSFTGSHRIAAWKAVGLEADAIEIDDSEYTEIMASMDLDPIYDEIWDFETFEEKAIELGII